VALRQFWPAVESAQADYETLRETTLAGRDTTGMVAARFARRGLAGLISWPTAEPAFTTSVIGAERAPWTPHSDPRLEALAAAFELLLTAAPEIRTRREVLR
jgi:hypothetical protein